MGSEQLHPLGRALIISPLSGRRILESLYKSPLTFFSCPPAQIGRMMRPPLYGVEDPAIRAACQHASK